MKINFRYIYAAVRRGDVNHVNWEMKTLPSYSPKELRAGYFYNDVWNLLCKFNKIDYVYGEKQPLGKIIKG